MQLLQRDLIRVFKKTNGRCFYCNGNGEAVDHFISKQKWKEWELDEPLGERVNELDNLFLACKSCNSKKSDKCPEDFIGNSWIAWNRYERANKRIGIKNSSELYFQHPPNNRPLKELIDITENPKKYYLELLELYKAFFSEKEYKENKIIFSTINE